MGPSLTSMSEPLKAVGTGNDRRDTMMSTKDQVPFMTKVLYLAAIQITVYTVWQMAVFTVTGNEASTLTQCFFTLWGTEVALLMLKKLIIRKDSVNEPLDDEDVA